jgi:anti-anti-sigma regulatory factor
MISDRSNPQSSRGKVKRTRATVSHQTPNLKGTSIDVERSGDWMPAGELREAALNALASGGDMILNLEGIGHLDASALQILLAIDVEQKKCGRSLQLANTSDPLQKWFEYAGVGDSFLQAGQKNDE